MMRMNRDDTDSDERKRSSAHHTTGVSSVTAVVYYHIRGGLRPPDVLQPLHRIHFSMHERLLHQPLSLLHVTLLHRSISSFTPAADPPSPPPPRPSLPTALLPAPLLSSEPSQPALCCIPTATPRRCPSVTALSDAVDTSEDQGSLLSPHLVHSATQYSIYSL